MNDDNLPPFLSQPENTPPPPPTPAPSPTPSPAPSGIVACLEMLLRNPGSLAHHIHFKSAAGIGLYLILIAVVSLSIFGLVIGLFSGGTQLWAAPLKICGGMLFSAAICLPSLYIFSCLSGIEIRLASLACILLGMVALTGVLLLGFAPISWVFSQSTESVPFFAFLNLIFWVIGLFFGIGFLRKFAGAKSGGHIVVWACMFILVCLQMTSTLRPIIGTSDHLLPKEKKFFLAYWVEGLGEESSSDRKRSSDDY